MAHSLALGPFLAEEDLRALVVATNPHLSKDMRDLFDNLKRARKWSDGDMSLKSEAQKFYEGVENIEHLRDREQKFQDAVNAITQARSKK